MNEFVARLPHSLEEQREILGEKEKDMREITPEVFGEIAGRLNDEDMNEWDTKPVTFFTDGGRIVIECSDEADAERVLYSLIAVATGR